jgi:hypothetical protein
VARSLIRSHLMLSSFCVALLEVYTTAHPA